MVDFLALHRGYELNPQRYAEIPDPILSGVQYSGEKLEWCTRQLGYMLGTDVYQAYLEGIVTPRFLKNLFLLHIDEPASAAAAYFALARKIRRPTSAVFVLRQRKKSLLNCLSIKCCRCYLSVYGGKAPADHLEGVGRELQRFQLFKAEPAHLVCIGAAAGLA